MPAHKNDTISNNNNNNKNIKKKTDHVHVRVMLAEDLLEAFLFIKRELGIKNNTEIIRFLIKEKAKELKRSL